MRRCVTAGPGDLWGSPVDAPEDDWCDLTDDELAGRRALAEQDWVDSRLGRENCP